MFFDWKMLGEEFETWPVVPIPDTTLLILRIYITMLGYLADGPFYFTKVPDNATEELNRILSGLDNTPTIPNNNNEQLLDLPYFKAKEAKKKEKKAQIHQQRKSELVRATSATTNIGSPLSPIAGGGLFLLSIDTGGDPSLLSPIAARDPQSPVTISSSTSSSLVTSGGLQSSITSGSPSLSSPVVNGGSSPLVVVIVFLFRPLLLLVVLHLLLLLVVFFLCPLLLVVLFCLRLLVVVLLFCLLLLVVFLCLLLLVVVLCLMPHRHYPGLPLFLVYLIAF